MSKTKQIVNHLEDIKRSIDGIISILNQEQDEAKETTDNTKSVDIESELKYLLKNIDSQLVKIEFVYNKTCDELESIKNKMEGIENLPFKINDPSYEYLYLTHERYELEYKIELLRSLKTLYQNLKDAYLNNEKYGDILTIDAEIRRIEQELGPF